MHRSNPPTARGARPHVWGPFPDDAGSDYAQFAGVARSRIRCNPTGPHARTLGTRIIGKLSVIVDGSKTSVERCGDESPAFTVDDDHGWPVSPNLSPKVWSEMSYSHAEANLRTIRQLNSVTEALAAPFDRAALDRVHAHHDSVDRVRRRRATVVELEIIVRRAELGHDRAGEPHSLPGATEYRTGPDDVAVRDSAIASGPTTLDEAKQSGRPSSRTVSADFGSSSR